MTHQSNKKMIFIHIDLRDCDMNRYHLYAKK